MHITIKTLFIFIITLFFLTGCESNTQDLNQLNSDAPTTEDVRVISTDNNEGLSLNGHFLNSQLPVNDEDFTVISAFGPRLQAGDDNRYDFHRGIDIDGELGDNIYSIGNGTLYKAYPEGSSAYPNGGNVIIVLYQLDVPFVFHNTTVRQFYGVYMHLDSFGMAAKNYLSTGRRSAVSKGEILGTMGQSGSTDQVHLHFETRLQTHCSLEYQLENPQSSCAIYGFDPHVNPIDLFNRNATGIYTMEFTSLSPYKETVHITVDPGYLNFNGIVFSVLSPLLSSPIYSTTLNFDLRTGFDASSTEALDDPNVDGCVIEPTSLEARTGVYDISFNCEIPESLWENRDQLEVRSTLLTTQGNEMEITETLHRR